MRLDNAQVLENSVPSTTVKSAKIMKKRSSNLRKSIGQELSDTPVPPDTNHEMYATNALYRTLCLYCQTAEKYLVAHYIKKHPQHEGKKLVIFDQLLETTFSLKNSFGSLHFFCPSKFRSLECHPKWLIDFVPTTWCKSFT